MRKISHGKLFHLQKMILVALLELRDTVMKRRVFNQPIKRLYYGKDTQAITSNLFRA
jgi:hypothetical protein